MLRNAWRLYKEGILHARLYARNEDASEHLRKTLEARRAQKCVDNWKDFIKRGKGTIQI